MAKKTKVEFKMQDGSDPEEKFKELSPINVNASASGIAEIMNQIALVSVGKHMINAGGIASAKTAPIHPYKLTIRTGRLSKSVLNAFNFSVAKLPFVKELSDKYIRGRTKEKFEDGRKEGFRKIFYDKTLKIVNGQMGTSVPYAYLHEYGIGKHPARPFLLFCP